MIPPCLLILKIIVLFEAFPPPLLSTLILHIFYLFTRSWARGPPAAASTSFSSFRYGFIYPRLTDLNLTFWVTLNHTWCYAVLGVRMETRASCYHANTQPTELQPVLEPYSQWISFSCSYPRTISSALTRLNCHKDRDRVCWINHGIP